MFGILFGLSNCFSRILGIIYTAECRSISTRKATDDDMKFYCCRFVSEPVIDGSIVDVCRISNQSSTRYRLESLVHKLICGICGCRCRNPWIKRSSSKFGMDKKHNPIIWTSTINNSMIYGANFIVMTFDWWFALVAKSCEYLRSNLELHSSEFGTEIHLYDIKFMEGVVALLWSWQHRKLVAQRI